MDLRCGSGKKFAELHDDIIEVRCPDRFCGATKGVVVLHQFSATSGELIETKKYRDPQRSNKNASHYPSAPVRSA